MQARYAILQVFIKSGLVKLDTSIPGDIMIHLDRSKIESVGVPAVGDFLMRLNVYKATADSVNGGKFYEDATSVSDEFVKLREIVLGQKQPRKVFVQCNTFIQDGQIVYKDYDASLEGVIQSYVERAI